MVRGFVTFILFNVFWSLSFAQITVDFTSSTQSGCGPLFVLFTDQSSASNGSILSWSWDFGDGTTATSNTGSITHVYNQPGLYDVTLVVSNGAQQGSTTKASFIQVLENPDIEFLFYPQSGCAPLQVNFTDNTVANGGSPIVDWNWSFSNGVTNNQASASIWFNTSGVFDATLEVTDGNGCSAILDSLGIIVTDPSPIAAIGVVGGTNGRRSCDPPLAVNYNSNSTGGNPPYTYNWNFFGQGSTTMASPVVNYALNGSFDASLTVTDQTGCSDTINRSNYVRIGKPTAGFNYSNQVYCSYEPIVFTNTSSNANSFFWDFDGVGTSTSTNSTFAFGTGGLYDVKLTATNGWGCSDSVTSTVNVEDVNASFTATPNYACKPPLSVSYQGTSQNIIANWDWTFGNGNSSNQQVTNNTFNTAGSFTDQLIVTTINGCKDTISASNVHVFQLNTNLSASPTNGCIPLTVNFSDNSTPIDSILSWSWDFGDGTTSNLQNPAHTYTQHGTFFAVCTIVTTSGCIYTDQVTISTGNKQSPSFSSSSNLFCASDPVFFTNTSTNSGLIDSYSWDFGDGNSSNQMSPSHQYLDTGYFDVSLTATYNGCDTVLTLPNYLYVEGPVISFTHQVNCDTPYDIEFTPTMIGETHWYWDYDDGTPNDSNTLNPIHGYNQTGNYNVSLEAFDSLSGCSFSETNLIQVRDVQANFTTSNNSPCAFSPVALNGLPSVDEVSYNWEIQNSNPLNSTASNLIVSFQNTGFQDIQLIVGDANGCSDTLVQTVRVFQPTADFTGDSLVGCTGHTVNFTDLSTSDTGVVSWAYSFGNGSSSALQNPSATYNYYQQGGYDVELIVEDWVGCTDTLLKTGYIDINQPYPIFTADTQTCQNSATTFQAIISGQNWSYNWDFGDGNSDTGVTTNHTYTNPGLYTVQYTVTDELGCDSSLSRIDYIDVQALPIADFDVDKTYSGCWPFEVEFSDQSASPNIVSYEWDFGDTSQGVSTGNSSIKHIYNFSGLIDVQLIVTTNYGCSDTLTKDDLIQIDGPFAQLSLADDTVCLGEQVVFNVDTSINVLNTTLNFGDQQSASLGGNFNSWNHQYNASGEYTIEVTIVDSAGACPKKDTLFAMVGDVHSSWSLDTLKGCAPFVFNGKDQSIGANEWNWIFSNGVNSFLDSVQVVFPQAGGYTIKLIASNDSTGCSDSITASIDVNNYPNTETIGETFACAGERVPLMVLTDGLNIQWSHSELMTDPTVFNPQATVTNDTRFYVSVTDDIGCLTIDSLDVRVQEKPEILSFPSDTTVLYGATLTHQVILDNSLNHFNFFWDPSDNMECFNCDYLSLIGYADQIYTLSIEDDFDCFSIDTSFILTVDNKINAYAPDAFSPNGDGLNDVYKITGNGIVELIDFQIYDRWGNLVFETTDLEVGWDGRYQNKSGFAKPNERYLFRANVRLFTGEEKTFNKPIVISNR